MRNWFQVWWYRPREVFLRRALFQVHLWVGIAIGLYVLAISLSGAVLVFEEEWEEVLHPAIFHAEGSRQPELPVSALLRQAREAYPDRQPTAIYAPNGARETYVVYLRKGDEILHAFLHPATGRIAGDTLPSTSFIRWVQDFHFNLLNGRSGRAVNGAGGLLLLLLCATGIVIWWPGALTWAGATRVNFSRSWKRVNWEFHSAAGFWTLVLLSTWAISGFYFGYAAGFSAFINRLSPLSQVEAPESKASKNSVFESIDGLVARSRSLAPANRFFGLQLPANKRAVYIVFMSREQPAEKRHCDYLYFDQFSGAYIKTWRRGISASWGDTVITSMVPLHFGTFGGTGVKILWSILGLTPALMFISGLIMWWNRALARRYRQWTARAVATSQR